jgi:nitrous oxidase accessory protein NosD
VANGDVYVEVYNNTITGFGPINFIAQNGIQLGYGATGTVHDNIISGNFYSGDGWTSAGILLFDVNAPDMKIFRNHFNDNQKNVSLTEDNACPNMYGGFYSDYGLCD